MIASHQPDATITLRKSGGGVFEITVNGTPRWSKRQTGAFPSDRDILAALEPRA